MIPCSSDDLEQLAFDTGATISMGGKFPHLTIGRLTFAAVDSPRKSPPPPAPTSTEGRRP